MPRLAFYTFGILKEKEGHPQVQGFFDRINSVFKEAKNSYGFIGLDDGSWGNYVSPVFYNPQIHADAPATLSLWEDLESVFAFAYKGSHSEAFRLRHEWALKPEWPTYAAWWVGDNHIPSREEACKRLEHLHVNGPCSFVFNFKKPFDNNGNPIELNRELISLRINSNKNKNK